MGNYSSVQNKKQMTPTTVYVSEKSNLDESFHDNAPNELQSQSSFPHPKSLRKISNPSTPNSVSRISEKTKTDVPFQETKPTTNSVSIISEKMKINIPVQEITILKKI
jgi:hypothetical protein